MKYLLRTQRCNLACSYCYIRQRPSRMTLEVVDRVLDFAYRTAPHDQRVDFGLFGGQPLLEFALLTQVVERIEQHPGNSADRTSCTVVSNGTLLTEPIANYLRGHDIARAPA